MTQRYKKTHDRFAIENHLDTFMVKFSSDGLYGPVKMFSAREVNRLRELCAEKYLAAPQDWAGGRATSNRVFYDLSMNDRVLPLIKCAVGNDVMLWGAQVMCAMPVNAKNWDLNTDMNTTRVTDLSVLIVLDSANEFLVSATYEIHAKCSEQHYLTSHHTYFNPQSGSVYFFNNSIWRRILCNPHGNQCSAILLHFSSPSAPIRLPLIDSDSEPKSISSIPQPPCIMIHGNARKGKNRMVTPPSAAGIRRPCLSTVVRQMNLPLGENLHTGWKSHRVFHGATKGLSYFGCYVSVLSSGKCPHRSHSHHEEEIITMLDGEAEVVTSIGESDTSPDIRQIKAGMCVYHSAQQYHTIRNCSANPATYVVFKWKATGSYGAEASEGGLFSFGSETNSPDRGLNKFVVHERATEYLTKLHIHFSSMRELSGYDPHTDSYDVALVILSGRVQTLEHELGPGGIVLYGTGEMHGLRNIGVTPATYLVIEFHGPAHIPDFVDYRDL